MTAVRSMPCTACPYRLDAPSGLWAEHEYEKLRGYDEPTFAQPFHVFACHATPEAYCHGWAVVHMNRGHAFELVALRLSREWDGVIPEAGVPMFESGNDAADAGQRDIETPGPETMAAADRLQRKYPRLQ